MRDYFRKINKPVVMMMMQKKTRWSRGRWWCLLLICLWLVLIFIFWEFCVSVHYFFIDIAQNIIDITGICFLNGDIEYKLQSKQSQSTLVQYQFDNDDEDKESPPWVKCVISYFTTTIRYDIMGRVNEWKEKSILKLVENTENHYRMFLWAYK